MIDKQQATHLIVEACPSLQPLWVQHLEEHGDDLMYIAAGDFACHLHALFLDGRDDCFPDVGRAIELLHTDGSAWVREFATIGILESIQNVWANSGADPALFVPYLGPESRRWWDGLNGFWSKARTVCSAPRLISRQLTSSMQRGYVHTEKFSGIKVGTAPKSSIIAHEGEPHSRR